MDVEHVLDAVPVVEEVLAIRLGPHEDPSVEPLGEANCPPLRRGDPNRAFGQIARVITGQQMERVAFGHGRRWWHSRNPSRGLRIGRSPAIL
jgi:hypothetical protein